MQTCEGLEPLSAAVLSQLASSQLPDLPDRSVDFVVCSQREQVPDPEAFLASVRQLLFHDGVRDTSNVEVLRLLPGHPAAPGFGLFATRELKPHVVLAEYGGELVSDEESRRREVLPDGRPNACLFSVSLSLEAEIDLDGNVEPRCLASFVNDNRGGAGDCPNVRFMEVLCGGGCSCRGGRQVAITHPHLVMLTSVQVAVGQELLTSYGSAYWQGLKCAPRK